MPITARDEEASDQLAREEQARMDAQHPPQTIDVFICPEPGCGNYYGSKHMANLSAHWTGHRGMNGEFWPDKAHTRAECPDCRDRGERRQRVLVRLPVPEVESRPAPSIPPEIADHKRVG